VTPLHTDALELLEGWHAPTPVQVELRRQYVAHLRAHPDGVRRSCLPDHLTASTLVLDASGGSVLLTLHAKAAQWFQLGGHIEPGDSSLAGAALREATEESGITTLALDPVPVHLDAHEVPFCGGRPGTRHLDVRFVAVAPPGARAEISEESSELRWWPVDALPSDEPSLRELVDLGRHRARHL
jgi:8-oxo-dGTP pyrophosphatase MutT (NUDIX family)